MAQPGPFNGTRRFELLSLLGAGGMGVVYRARDRERSLEVALKTVRVGDAEAILRFKNEFHSLQDLAHPNLVSLGELFVEEGQWFFTMELIEGVDFLAHVRPGAAWSKPFTSPSERERAWSRPTEAMGDSPLGEAIVTRRELPPLDEGRLRASLLQLGHGLCALHDAGKIHRDIKPSNILVTGDGRVVLCDFGLATDLASVGHQSERDVFGTTAYMAPEQAASQPVGPESDWYAVGVVLYEALTGRLPFEGPAMKVLLDKQRQEPPPPRLLWPEAPADLDGLCSELLRFNRARRPAGPRVLSRLAPAAPPRSSSSQTSTPPFVGREAELARLAAAFEKIRAGAQETLVVRGESGVGKSALVRRFLERLEPRAVVLKGRCYERESIPYKAFDGIVDALSRYMRGLGKAEAAALLPQRAGLLPQVFPVLGRVAVVAEAPRPRQALTDPHELRSRVFAALRELLTRVCERAPLVLVIDDLQWADADSFALLGELLRPPDAPSLLLLCTSRAPVTALAHDEIQLPRLSPEEARALATHLIDRAGAPVQPALIADEAAGHPLFIDELVRHIVAHGAQPGLPRLDEAIGSRIAGLDDESRRLVELVAVAGTPLPREVAAEAAEIELGGIDRRVAELRVANLVRTHHVQSVEPYHDRVREAVLARLDEGARQAAHRRLAAAMEGRADAETLAVHKRGAGDRSGAARYSERAAGEAAAALAFDRAARLYRQALELGSGDARERRQLQARLGEALAAAGRGHEAAEAYQAAAEGATVAEALNLRRRSSEQLLISGHIDEGLAALDQVLHAVGMGMPKTPRRALFSLAWGRARIRLRGVGFRERDPSQVAAEQLTRIDICCSVAIGLGIVDTIRGADFQTRNLLLSLEAGEPYRVARALALEAGFCANDGAGAKKRVSSLLEQSRLLAERVGHPQVLGLYQLMSGIAAFLQGRFRDCLQLADAAQVTLRERCSGVTWELDNAQLLAMWALQYLGELREVFRRGQACLRDGRERGDQYMTVNLRSRLMQLVHLCADNPGEARREVQASLADWTQEGFHIQHYNCLAMAAQIELYAGDGARALQLLDEKWGEMSRSLLLRVTQVKVEMTHLRGAAALAAGVRQIAAAQARALVRHGLPWSAALGRLLSAGLSPSLGALGEAAGALDACGMALYAQAARRRAAELGNDPPAVAKIDEWMRGMEIQNPARLAAMLAPLAT